MPLRRKRVVCTHSCDYFAVYLNPINMQEIELQFPTLKDMLYFKQITEVKELRIDTYEKLLTGKFPENEIEVAKDQFKARSLN